MVRCFARPTETTSATENGAKQHFSSQQQTQQGQHMPMIFFSGGLDSTTLAFDLAQNPHRYGQLRHRDEHRTLYLFTYGDAKKRDQLRPLFEALNEVSQVPIEWLVEKCPLQHRDAPQSRWETMSPVGADYTFDKAQMPFTPGLHLWLASWAFNVLGFGPKTSYNPNWAYFGFVYDGAMWQKHDAGTIQRTDTSPEFVEALNQVAATIGDGVRFRAPFLDGRMNKYMVVSMARELEVPLELTSSCVLGWGENCGRCCQCLARQAAIREVDDE